MIFTLVIYFQMGEGEPIITQVEDCFYCQGKGVIDRLIGGDSFLKSLFRDSMGQPSVMIISLSSRKDRIISLAFFEELDFPNRSSFLIFFDNTIQKYLSFDVDTGRQRMFEGIDEYHLLESLGKIFENLSSFFILYLIERLRFYLKDT